MNTDAPKPKFQRRAEDRPDEVLDAALTLFSTKGYARTSVSEIARAAGLSKGAVYLYFPSKHDILLALVRRAVGTLITDFEAFAALDTLPARSAITQMMTQIGAAMSDPARITIPKLVLREGASAPEIATLYREEVLSRGLPVLETLVRRGIARGELRAVDPHHATCCLIGAMVSHILLTELFGMPCKGTLPELIETHLGIIFDGLTAPLAQEISR